MMDDGWIGERRKRKKGMTTTSPFFSTFGVSEFHVFFPPTTSFHRLLNLVLFYFWFSICPKELTWFGVLRPRGKAVDF
jgi:hypothetical protein